MSAITGLGAFGVPGPKTRSLGKDDVVDVGTGKAVRAGVVLEGRDDPLLGLDRGEPRQAGALQDLERSVVG